MDKETIKTLFCQYQFIFLFEVIAESAKEIVQFIAYVYTSIYERVIFWLGGNCPLILGINAMNPKTKVATVPIFYGKVA